MLILQVGSDLWTLQCLYNLLYWIYASALKFCHFFTDNWVQTHFNIIRNIDLLFINMTAFIFRNFNLSQFVIINNLIHFPKLQLIMTLEKKWNFLSSPSFQILKAFVLLTRTKHCITILAKDKTINIFSYDKGTRYNRLELEQKTNWTNNFLQLASSYVLNIFWPTF